jgi:hypothetical protein
LECYRCHKFGHFAKECRAIKVEESKPVFNTHITNTGENPEPSNIHIAYEEISPNHIAGEEVSPKQATRDTNVLKTTYIPQGGTLTGNQAKVDSIERTMPVVKVAIFGHEQEVQGLVDTGSSLNFISSKLYEQLQLNQPQHIEKITPSNFVPYRKRRKKRKIKYFKTSWRVFTTQP